LLSRIVYILSLTFCKSFCLLQTTGAEIRKEVVPQLLLKIKDAVIKNEKFQQKCDTPGKEFSLRLSYQLGCLLKETAENTAVGIINNGFSLFCVCPCSLTIAGP
jgi:hypothetical protein